MRDLAALGINVNPHGPAEQRVPCPQCSRGKRDDALGVNIETGVYHCFRCGWKGCAGGESGAPAARGIQRLNDPGVAERKRQRLRATWSETVPLNHPKARAVRRYLEARALGDVLHNPPKVLRAHPGLSYWDATRDMGTFPAMVALFHGAAGSPVTLHVTYLRSDGCAKAPVPSPKKILGVPVRGATRGGAIHLYEPSEGVLGLAEGIETALSLRLIENVPVWAAFCADNLARVRLPGDLRELHISVDQDESGKGQQVAIDLARRVYQFNRRAKVSCVTPDLPGCNDLNDELMRRRAS